MQSKKKIKVELVYRNYKPLHSLYETLQTSPPGGVEYIVPTPNTKLKRFYKFYRKFKYFPPTKYFIRMFESLFFRPKKRKNSAADIYQYINMIDRNPPDKPYVVDIEHAASLISFTPDGGRVKTVIKFLTNDNCKAVTCLSKAAKRNLKELLGEDYAQIEKKVDVIYPALREVKNIRPDYQYMSKTVSGLRLVFVGNQAYLKGLEELLEAVRRVNSDFGPNKLELHVISNDASKLIDKYRLPNVWLYQPKFTREEILSKFFVPADAFVMPTKEDTFGMAVLDSLSCGTAVITTRQFALPELVNDGEDGILLKLEAPILDRTVIPDKEGMNAITASNLDLVLMGEIENTIRDILAGRIDIKKIGTNGPKKFARGQQFSVSRRNQQLLALYRDYFSATAM
jgi:glycosyltransferase involved in cell wall biosynthesis